MSRSCPSCGKELPEGASVCAPESNPRWVLAHGTGWRKSIPAGWVQGSLALGYAMTRFWPSGYNWYCNSPASRYYPRVFLISPWWPRVHTLDFAEMVRSHLTQQTHSAAFATVMEELGRTYGHPVKRKDLPWPEPKRTPEPRPPREPRKQHAYWVFALGIRKSPLTVVAFQRSLWAPGKKTAAQRAPGPTQPFKLDALTDYMVCADDKVVRRWTNSDSSTVYSVCENNGARETVRAYEPKIMNAFSARSIPRFDCFTLSVESAGYEDPSGSESDQQRVVSMQESPTSRHDLTELSAQSHPETRMGVDESQGTELRADLRLAGLIRPVIDAKDQATWAMKPDVLRRDLVALIELFVNTPGRWILILNLGEAGGRYVQLLAQEDGSILCEASSNNFLEGPDRLSRRQERALADLGWTEPGAESRPNWWTAEATTSPDTRAVARRLLETLEDVFDMRGSDTIVAMVLSSSLRGHTPASEATAQPGAGLQPRETEGGPVVGVTGERLGSRFRFAASQPGASPVENEPHPSVSDERIPVPPRDAPWTDLVTFALTHNAYNRVGGSLADLANSIRARYRCDRMLPEDLDKLRAALFFEQGRYHDSGEDPIGPDLRYIRAMVGAIGGLGRGSVSRSPDPLPWLPPF